MYNVLFIRFQLALLLLAVNFSNSFKGTKLLSSLQRKLDTNSPYVRRHDQQVKIDSSTDSSAVTETVFISPNKLYEHNAYGRCREMFWNNQTRSFEHFRTDTPQSISHFLSNCFLPNGEISKDYYRYITWRAAQRFVGATSGVFGTQALLLALGFKKNRIGLAAATTWVLKDFLGKFSRIYWASQHGRKFDSDAKKWRFRATLLFATGNLLEIVTFIFPAFFLITAATANALKQMAILTSSATRNTIYKSFANNGDNIGDITAKGEAQIAVIDLLGMAAGIAISRAIGVSKVKIGLVFFLLSIIDLSCAFQEIQSVVFHLLNFERSNLVFQRLFPILDHQILQAGNPLLDNVNSSNAHCLDERPASQEISTQNEWEPNVISATPIPPNITVSKKLWENPEFRDSEIAAEISVVSKGVQELELRSQADRKTPRQAFFDEVNKTRTSGPDGIPIRGILDPTVGAPQNETVKSSSAGRFQLPKAGVSSGVLSRLKGFILGLAGRSKGLMRRVGRFYKGLFGTQSELKSRIEANSSVFREKFDKNVKKVREEAKRTSSTFQKRVKETKLPEVDLSPLAKVMSKTTRIISKTSRVATSTVRRLTPWVVRTDARNMTWLERQLSLLTPSSVARQESLFLPATTGEGMMKAWSELKTHSIDPALLQSSLKLFNQRKEKFVVVIHIRLINSWLDAARIQSRFGSPVETLRCFEGFPVVLCPKVLLHKRAEPTDIYRVNLIVNRAMYELGLRSTAPDDASVAAAVLQKVPGRFVSPESGKDNVTVASVGVNWAEDGFGSGNETSEGGFFGVDEGFGSGNLTSGGVFSAVTEQEILAKNNLTDLDLNEVVERAYNYELKNSKKIREMLIQAGWHMDRFIFGTVGTRVEW